MTPDSIPDIPTHAAHVAYVGIGSNLGDSRRMVADAIAALDHLPETRLLKASSLYRAEPLGESVVKEQPDFINAVAALSTRLSSLELLATLQTLEDSQGRIRSVPNAPRTLDLDLLLYADEQIRASTLTLPHPRLHLRAFVLVPLAEIAPARFSIPGRGRLDAWLPAVAGQRIRRL
ncbi:MAG: 2-amino-4-hydroxy-6-hydroxymethyldihydropteridine diphosphokinase [Zoogloeaceae bacterium]|jgi:2-amino-4-hydroxy-6-hydroxymethyldihydropteridine diphosphokinase|nr:2-amino-4-hydroxy-6-hydroxymethyldihydropteridine diphosphokinase [Zoogloeaceae bacterium]